MIRIVKMIFKEELLPNFMELFAEVQPKINGFEGCKGVELLEDINDPCTLFTYSHWENEDALNAYRHSAFFEKTWKETKAMFGGKPAAWSVEKKK
ncbi:MAG: antibiotic biosynthesis monooxygenase [Salibacteraceae bacterium]|nr:antibiotic biosynthesis monooxygenase [Salibacteraceae bacterium]